jgi:hypothetical protein
VRQVGRQGRLGGLRQPLRALRLAPAPYQR